jgi:hypothetical protein
VRPLCTAFSYTLPRRANKEARGESKDEQRTLGTSKLSFLAEEPRLPLPFWARRPGGRLPRLVLLVEPAVDEGPDQGAGRDTASEALAAQARVDAFFEAHRHRLSQGSHHRPQPYTSRPPPATDRSGLEGVVRLGGDADTNGAVVGALLGARFGTGGIPFEWLRDVKGWEYLLRLL